MPDVYTALTYKDIFDDYNDISLEDLLEGLPTISAIKYLAYTSAQLHIRETDKNIQNALLDLWTTHFPEDIKRKINEATQRKFNPSIFDNITLLFTIEDILEIHKNINDENLTNEQELSLFKFYLWEAEKWTQNQESFLFSKNKKNVRNIDEYIDFSLPLILLYNEHFSYKDFRSQAIKAIYFFEACEKNQFFSKYLEIFLKEYQLKTWHEYLIKILEIYVRPFDSMKTPFMLTFSNDNTLVIHFLEHFCLNLNKYTHKPYFKDLREKPVLKIADKQYLFLNLNFLIDKIFQGIQFDLYSVLLKNKVIYNGHEFKNFPQFKSLYGSSISELGIFYRIMESCFGKSDYIRKDGDQIKDIIGEGCSDYYMRDKNKVYLFEYKDVLWGDNVKSSNDIKIIRQELEYKFVKDRKGKDEGISQLANNVRKMREGVYNEIDKCDYKKVIIYPILLYTDSSFSIPGINHILRKLFRSALALRNLQNDFHIQDVVMIHIDDLIIFQDLFHDKKLKLNHCLKNYILSYYGKKSNPQEEINGLEPFHITMLKEIQKLRYQESPRILQQEISKILQINS